MRPYFCSFMYGHAARVTLKAPFRCTFCMISAHRQNKKCEIFQNALSCKQHTEHQPANCNQLGVAKLCSGCLLNEQTQCYLKIKLCQGYLRRQSVKGILEDSSRIISTWFLSAITLPNYPIWPHLSAYILVFDVFSPLVYHTTIV